RAASHGRRASNRERVHAVRPSEETERRGRGLRGLGGRRLDRHLGGGFHVLPPAALDRFLRAGEKTRRGRQGERREGGFRREAGEEVKQESRQEEVRRPKEGIRQRREQRGRGQGSREEIGRASCRERV